MTAEAFETGFEDRHTDEFTDELTDELTDTVTLALQMAPVDTLPEPGDPAWTEWLSPAELAYCHGMQRAGEHLAARLLAKQAAADAVGWPLEVPWADLEIRRRQLAGPELVVVGDLRQWCADQGVRSPGVSITHAAGHTAAVAWTGPAEEPAR